MASDPGTNGAAEPDNQSPFITLEWAEPVRKSRPVQPVVRSATGAAEVVAG